MYQKYKLLISNFSYLVILQFITLFLPIAMYPYLIRVLGTEIYGKIIFAQAIVAYFSIIINYGFNISATKDVSINRDDRNKLSEIFSSVFIIKTIIWILSLLFLIAISLLFEPFKSDYLLYLLSFGICFNELFFQQFFFQGIEEMKYITLINVFSKLLFFGLLFILVKSSDDYLLVPLLNSLGGIVGGIIAFYIICRTKSIPFRIQPKANLMKYFRESTPFFLSRFSSVLVHKTNTVIIGSFIGYVEVSYYDLAQKILSTILIPFDLLNQVVYPHVARTKDMILVKKMMVLSIGGALFIYILLLMVQKSMVELIAGKELLPAIPLIDLLCVGVFISSTSYFLGNTVLVVMGYSKQFNRSVIDTSILYILLCGLLLVFNLIDIYNLAIVSLIVDFLCLLYRFIAAYKYKLL